MNRYKYLFNYDRERPVLRYIVAKDIREADEKAEAMLNMKLDCYVNLAERHKTLDDKHLTEVDDLLFTLLRNFVKEDIILSDKNRNEYFEIRNIVADFIDKIEKSA